MAHYFLCGHDLARHPGWLLVPCLSGAVAAGVLLLGLQASAPVQAGPLAEPAAAPALSANPDYADVRYFGAGTIEAVAAGDFDGDGALDLAADAGSGANVYFNDGQGNYNFQPGSCASRDVRCLSLAANTSAVAVGDINGDGALDVAVGSVQFCTPGPVGGCSGGQNYAFLNDGAGNFPLTRAFGTGTDTTAAVALGDLNGDADLDVAVANTGPNTGVCSDGIGQYMCPQGEQSRLYLNAGDGNFTITRTFGAATDAVGEVLLADLNGDLDLDIIARHLQTPAGPARVVVYFNSGAETFYSGAVDCAAPPGNVECVGAGLSPLAAVADMDGDGDLDIVGGSAVYRNNGGGGFFTGAVDCAAPPANVRCLGTGTEQALAVGDANADGALDVLTAGANLVAGLYLNDGSGVFAEAARVVVADNGLFKRGAALADVNGDSTLDAVLAQSGQGMIYLNQGGGQVAGAGAFRRTFGAGTDVALAVAVGDVNGDGALDVVVGNYGGQPGTVYLNDGTGRPGYGTAAVYTFGSPTDSMADNRLELGDLNGDGALDIIQQLTDSLGRTLIQLNDGAGRFPGTAAFTRAVSSGATALAVGDVNQDGALDLAVCCVNNLAVVHLNDGAGAFPAAPAYTRPISGSSSSVDDLAIGDLNGDGAPDIALAFRSGPSLVVLNDGTATFTGTQAALRSLGTETHPGQARVALGDLNGDGALDVVVAGRGRDLAYLNDGAGNFDWPGSRRYVDISTDVGADVWARDMNGDGALDVVVAGNGQDDIHLNDGAGNFVSAWDSPAGGDAYALGDLNADGAVDLVEVNILASHAVYFNGATGPARLTDTAPRAGLTHPAALANLNFAYADPAVRSGEALVTYTLSDREGDGVRLVQGYYSPDGGGRWLPAAAGPGSQTAGLATLGGVLSLDGTTGSYVIRDPFSGFPTTAATVAFWMRSATVERGGAPFSYASAGSPNDLLLNDDRNFDIAIAGQSAANTGISANDGYWHHLALTWRSSDGRTILYKDGRPVYTTTLAAGQAISTTNGALVLGQDQDATGGGFQAAQAFDGQLDEVRVYNRVLTPAQIQAILTPQPVPGDTGLVLYWRFNEGSGTTARDFTAADRDGALVGAVRGVGAREHAFRWDLQASGFFGASDQMVFRLVALPDFRPSAYSVPGPYQRPHLTAQTVPFRLRGTQVQVVSGTQPLADALVYRLPAAASFGGALIGSAGNAFHTDHQGYLQGRGELNEGDQLLALAPVLTSPEGYALFHTNGVPTPDGLTAYTVPASGGAQVIAVSPQRPLYLFDLDVSLEWDAHNDTLYLDTLAENLKRASRYLYDFTNGQMALGDVFVYQNADNWNSSHLAIRANNRLRPYATLGGLVLTPTTDSALTYGPGQAVIGATWNRYGRPGQMLGDDWPVILAHELAHYLLYQDDVYLGLDAGNLIPVSSCLGSAMGDLYDRPDNSEFIFDPAYWNANCSQTLAYKNLGRTEWQTLLKWYPALVAPGGLNSGPSAMPFDLTTVSIFEPLTPTQTLPDPTFYAHYPAGSFPSGSAQAVLFQSSAAGDWLLDLGGLVGGQSRITARGAAPGDRLCLFDRAASVFGCQAVAAGDQLPLRLEPAWNPTITLTPVNSETLSVTVTAVAPGLVLQARLFPDLAYAPPAITLAPSGGQWVGSFVLTPTGLLNGHLQLWVADDAPGSRRESVIAYSLGGNPGVSRAGTGIGVSRAGTGIGVSRAGTGIGVSRAGTGIGVSRAGTGIGVSRAGTGIGVARSGNAPLLSPDGQLIYFTTGDTDFITGTVFAIQTMPGLPDLPPGRTLIGQGYALVASPGAVLPPGSVSLQYLSNTVLEAGALEEDLTLYFHDGAQWRELPTVRDPYADLAVAPSQGPGLYALLASVQIQLPAPGWNLLAYPVRGSRPVTEALLSISGVYTTVYGFVITDSVDPWKVHDVNAPAWVNDLRQLAYGQSYWINVSRPVTTHLAPGAQTVTSAGIFSEPPSTLYGTVAPALGQAGQAVSAWVGGQMCGLGTVISLEVELRYVVDVPGEGSSTPGCGAAGRLVTLRLGTSPDLLSITWELGAVRRLDLLAQSQLLFMPLIQR